jgi:restriction system protein
MINQLEEIMIPDFQSIMLPLLQALGNEEEKSVKILKEEMINHFNITDEEQSQKTPNNKQFTYSNRIAWAISYIKMAELINSPQRGSYKITEPGKKVLKNPPDKITISFLKTFENFEKNRNPGKPKKHNLIDNNDDQENNGRTPDELLELGYSQIIENLREQLKQKIKECDPFYFEQIVLDLLLKMGYGGSEIDNSEVTSKTADEGIDGIIKEDKLGLDKIYIQAKKWENTVGRPEIQKFVGALQGKRAKKGVFITTSDFSKEAYEYVKVLDVSVILIDGDKLSQYMIENELGVSLKHDYKIYSIDNDYFIED